MCHENFVLDFGPRLNFIIGHNGSGKSAILTGISICLGAKASETNRGSSLKDLIKEGANNSHIQVVLANEGEDAYEPGKYGSEIIIERVLRRDVQNAPYVLKSENGKKVSQKKSDLDAILDYFNIAVNNPMAFLSQDAARSFLTASTDEQKYKFFMRGTLMEEIHQNLKHSKCQVDNMELKIIRMKEALVRLKDDAREAKKLHERLLSSNDLRERQRILHGKYFWMQADNAQDLVDEVKESLVEIENTIQQLDRYIHDYESKIANFEVTKSDWDTKVRLSTERYKELADIASQKHTDAMNVKNNVDATVAKIDQTKNDNSARRKRIVGINLQISQEEEKIKAKNGGSRDVLQSQLETLEQRSSQVEAEKLEIIDKLSNIDNSNKEQYDELETQIQDKRQIIQNLQSHIQKLKGSKVDELAPYSNEMRNALRDIKRAKFRSPVLGPAGTYMSLKSGSERWGPLIEAQIANQLNAFVVENITDQRALQSILKHHRARANIVIRKAEEFDYSSGVPSKDFTTILDCLHFSNTSIKYFLIDISHVESAVLANDRTEAQQILERRTHNVTQTLSIQDRGSGQRSSINRNGGFRVDPIYFDDQIPKLRPKDRSQDVGSFESRVRAEQSELRDLQIQRDQIISHMKAEKQHLTSKRRSLENEGKRIKNEIYQITLKLNDDADTGKLEALIEDREATEQEIQVYNSAIADLHGELEKMKNQLQEKLQIYEEAKSDLKNAKGEISGIKAKLLELESERQINITKLQHFEKSKQLRRGEAKQMAENLPAWERNIQENIIQAEESCKREEADSIRLETIDAVKHEIEKITAQVELANEDLGKSPEQIVEEDEAARKKYADAKQQFDQAVENKRYYHSSLADRLKAFRESRAVTFLEADWDFKTSLQFRNFTGNLDFDNDKNRLTMYVSTKNDKKPRHVDSLSGGEKSFSQIALLLATWKPMRSRIKGLDEFDVFMDQVNRKIGMRLMLQKLSSERSQTIFITPQDIGQIADLDERFVRIHRIRDPRASRS